MLKKIIIGFVALLFIVAIFIFRPVPIVTEDKALVETGVVAKIKEGGVKDVVIRLKDNNRIFYINRGLEKGLDLEDLSGRLIGNEVTVKYPKYWTPLDWNDKIKHISKLEINGEVIFDEFRK